MVQLVPMTKLEFDAFIELSMREHAQGQVRAGRWRAEEADEIIRGMRDQLLPDGLATPNHFFFVIQDEDSGESVGELWYTIAERDGERQFYVMDVQVREEYRRRGYGSAAFVAMEEQARAMGITTISLHVFRHSLPARAMYEKLGYAGSGEMMSKAL